MRTALSLTLAATLLLATQAAAQQDKQPNDLARQLQALKPAAHEPGSPEAKKWQATLSDCLRRRREQVNSASSAAWNNLKGKDDWEKFRAEKLRALRDSLLLWPEAPKQLNVRVTATLKGEGYQVENLIYESRPGL